jgi:hypothetical protein
MSTVARRTALGAAAGRRIDNLAGDSARTSKLPIVIGVLRARALGFTPSPIWGIPTDRAPGAL